ncbi:unnamed protein product [Polarella glacialis]|uniref:Protein RER1 n=1 Tax=Polarella glacialis TaxID=89957 RepID=A0A813JJH3_POLGL|nr:unnamed protein product [Polarella glacialis]
MEETQEESSSPMLERLASVQRTIQYWGDKTTIWVKTRWCALAFMLVIYCIRVYLIEGFFIVTYGLGIYMLNLFIGFLSPAVDPETEEDGGALPTEERGEFRPFTRKLTEFKFWVSTIRAVAIGFVMTFFSAFDLPVFWPILLAYFIVLFVLTMKDRVRHMMKHKYLPISLGKQTYGDCGKVEVPGADKSEKSDK